MASILGRSTAGRTLEAVKAFQEKRKLSIKMPGAIGPKTLAALFPEAGKQAEMRPLAAVPWLDLGIRKKELHESRDYKELSTFLKSDGRTLGDPRRLPWCGDFVETCIAVTLPTEALPTNPYLARNWLKLGSAIRPTLGAVLVFWRGSQIRQLGPCRLCRGRELELVLRARGQSVERTVAPISKARLLGARWPASVARPEIHLPRMSGGVISINEA